MSEIDPFYYGCYNKPTAETLWVKDGMIQANTSEGDIACYRMKEIPNRMSRDCRYDLRATDPRCRGCERNI